MTPVCRRPVLAIVMLIAILAAHWPGYPGARAEAQETRLTLKSKGAVVKELTLEDLTRAVPPVTITVYEPHEDRERPYEAVDFTRLLDVTYGPAWRETDEILFTCLDGYQPSIPVTDFRKHRAFLAFAAKGAPFELVNRRQANEQVTLGPYYLVWDNVASPALKKAGASGWPYQVTAVDLIRFADRFPQMAPPGGASPAVLRGFQTFRRKCMTCHAINGEGGTKAFDLNYPVSVTEYWKEPWLRRWIADPSRMRPGTTMPAFDGDGDHARAIEDIVAYLEAMATRKRPPVRTR